MLGFSSPAPKKLLGAAWIARKEISDISNNIKMMYLSFLKTVNIDLFLLLIADYI